MKKRTIIRWLSVLDVLLIIGCVGIHAAKDNRGPEIIFPNKKVVYTDGTKESQLLEGITAIDRTDGDVTSSLRVLFVVPNTNKTAVTVEYVAKDRSNNVTRASRIYDYDGNESSG